MAAKLHKKETPSILFCNYYSLFCTEMRINKTFIRFYCINKRLFLFVYSLWTYFT